MRPVLGAIPATVTISLIRSTAVLWFVIRVTGFLVGITGRPPAGTLLVSLLILTLMWLRIKRDQERILYANLAISSASVSIMIVVAAASLEILAWVLLGPVLLSGGERR